jgi:CheY-like chemotaxis protein
MEVADQERPDLILTDQAMPEMTGVQLARALRTRWPSIPVIIATGYAELKAQAEDIIVINKPFTRDDLARVIALALSAPTRGTDDIARLQPL